MCIYPGHFVKEDDLALLLTIVEVTLQAQEGVMPVKYLGDGLAAVARKRFKFCS